MANPIIYDGTPGAISGSTPFGYYDNDLQFQNDGPRIANYCANKLGYPVMDVELDDVNFYQCFEDAVSIYAEELYQSKIKDNYLALEGSSTGSTLNNIVVSPNLQNTINISETYGAQAGVGGFVNWRSGSIELTANVQVYNLKDWASGSQGMAAGDRVVVQRVMYQATPAQNQYYDPYIGGSINYQGASENFGWASYSPGLNYMLFPVFWDIERIQEIEMSNYVRRAHATFEIIGDDIRIMPVPEYSGGHLWIYYAFASELSSLTGNSPYGTNKGLIANPALAPYANITYTQINQPGKQWIKEYTAALSSELLGLVRGKYSQVPVPGAEVVLNSTDLISRGQSMQTALREKLRQDLDDMTRRSQLERQQAENASLHDTLNNIPIPIYIG
jgi:hypothetical protein